jgi:hypothetical protein
LVRGKLADEVAAVEGGVEACAVVGILKEEEGDTEEQLTAEVDYECPEKHSHLLVAPERSYPLNQSEKGLLTVSLICILS